MQPVLREVCVPFYRQKSSRHWALLLGPLFFLAALYFYEHTGLSTRATSNWQFTHLTKIGALPLSLSDYNFLAAIFCTLCGIIYFVLGAVARRHVEILFGYIHLALSLSMILAVAHYIRGLPVADSLQPIPMPYQIVFIVAQVPFLLYAAMAILRPPPED